MHRSSLLILLSRIDGDATAQQVIAPDVWIVREQASFKLVKPLSSRASEPGPSNGNRFAEANPIRSFF
jgi:hypothetical protein